MSSIFAIRRGIAYEGDENFMRAIHPIPTTTSVTSCEFYQPQIAGPGRSLIFREDSFDPVTRIRRGRFYHEAGGLAAISQECVHNYPFGPHIGAGGQSGWQADAYYRPVNSQHISGVSPLEGSQVDLGDGEFQTAWRVVAVEKISTGDLLFTLRAISAIGALPRVRNNLDTETRTVAEKAIEPLVSALHVQLPTPTVDVCRESTRLVLAKWIGPTAAAAKDLGQVIKKIPDAHESTKWAATIISRLHPRGKSAEQEKQTALGTPIRPIVNQDAELSVYLLGFILRDIGWAE
jgi:hypothetical protein